MLSLVQPNDEVERPPETGPSAPNHLRITARSNRWLGIMQPSTEVNNAFSFLKAQGAMHGVSSGVTKQ